MTINAQDCLGSSRYAKRNIACALRRIVALLLAAMLVFVAVPFCGLTSLTAYAETSAEKQAEADAISASIDALQSQLNETQATLAAAQEEYNTATAAAEKAAARAASAQTRIVELQEKLGDRATDMYRNGSLSFLDVMLGASSFRDFLTSWDALERISSQDAQLIQESKDVRAEAQEAEAEAEEQQAIAADAIKTAEAAEQEIADNKAKLEEQLEAVNEEVAMLLAKEEEERISAEEAARREAYVNSLLSDGEGDSSESGSSGNSDSSNSSSSSSSGSSISSGFFADWVLPCSYYGVTCEFGYSPITYSHNGIDLGASEGTPIYSAGPGTVTYVGWYDTGGNAVIVSHGSGVRTIYMHQSKTACSVGQEVAAGDLIGYVGTTGLSTGPHLHFQIEINNTPTNPRNFFNF